MQKEREKSFYIYESCATKILHFKEQCILTYLVETKSRKTKQSKTKRRSKAGNNRKIFYLRFDVP